VRPGPEIRANRLIAAAQEQVFDFLADLENHWRLADRFIEVLTLEREADGRAYGGHVLIRGPLGLRRMAATHVLAADPPQQMVGVAELGRRTRAFVRWKLKEGEGGTQVLLEATVDRTGWLDRLVLVLGARAWLERRFRVVLERLAEAFPVDGGGSGGPPGSPGAGTPLREVLRPSGRGQQR
jgi:hypothetical protein